MFTGRSLLLGAGVALLCDVLAYTLQANALQRMPRSLFSILTSTEPAAGAILGLLALDQRITPAQWAGIVLFLDAPQDGWPRRSRTGTGTAAQPGPWPAPLAPALQGSLTETSPRT